MVTHTFGVQVVFQNAQDAQKPCMPKLSSNHTEILGMILATVMNPGLSGFSGGVGGVMIRSMMDYEMAPPAGPIQLKSQWHWDAVVT